MTPAEHFARYVVGALQPSTRLTPAQLLALASTLGPGPSGRAAFVHGVALQPASFDVDVVDTYRAALGRDPDPSRISYWTHLLAASGGAALPAFRQQLWSSSEAFTHAGGTDAAWVAALYRQVLGWDPPVARVAAWEARAVTAGRPAVAAAFDSSPDAAARRVRALYVRILGRSGRPDRVDHWASVMLHAGTVAVEVGLAASDEAFAAAQHP